MWENEPNEKKTTGNERLHLTVHDKREIESIKDELRWIRSNLREDSGAYELYTIAITCIEKATHLGSD